MKKILFSVFLVAALASVSSARVFIGSRQAGMGGTGVASAVGLNAVAFNPAGLMKGPSGEFLLSLGAASQGVDQIVQSFSSASDPAQYMVDNYSSNLDARGNIYGILGFNFNHIGVSVLVPSIYASISKPADTLDGSITALATTAYVLTLGHTFSTPGIPIASLDVGANLKAITIGYGNVSITEPTAGNPTTAQQTVAQASGMGLDLGARTTIEIPMLADFSVGIALRDLAQTIKYKPKVRDDDYAYTGPNTEPTFTPGTEEEGDETEATYPTTTSIGCAGTVPGIGLKLAADISSISSGTGILATSSDTVTSIGLEYPLLLNTLILRAGVASSPNISMTTWGVRINMPFLTLEFANIIDGKNPKNTSYVIDAGIAF